MIFKAKSSANFGTLVCQPSKRDDRTVKLSELFGNTTKERFNRITLVTSNLHSTVENNAALDNSSKRRIKKYMEMLIHCYDLIPTTAYERNWLQQFHELSCNKCPPPPKPSQCPKKKKPCIPKPCVAPKEPPAPPKCPEVCDPCPKAPSDPCRFSATRFIEY